MKANSIIPPEQNGTIRDRLLNKKQVAEILGISTRTLDRLVAAGLLEKVFVGASPRFRASDIARVMENGV